MPEVQQSEPVPARGAVVMMGVTGCGKSTLGAALAEDLGWCFIEGDALHPGANVEKMRAGVPLDDADRWPWLDRVARAIAQGVEEHPGVVASCSALKRRYRERLRAGAPGLRFVLLHGDRELLAQRLAARTHDYMPASLLDSQLSTLELPDAGEGVLAVDVAADVAALRRQIRRSLRLPEGAAHEVGVR